MGKEGILRERIIPISPISKKQLYPHFKKISM